MHIFFKKIVEKSKFVKNINLDERYISFIHGRECCVEIKKDKWLSIKGCGWQIGPPTVYYSKKDPLYFGILDADRAKREYRVSKHLNSKFKNIFAKCVDIVEYDIGKIQKEFNIKLPNNLGPPETSILFKIFSLFKSIKIILSSNQQATTIIFSV